MHVFEVSMVKVSEMEIMTAILLYIYMYICCREREEKKPYDDDDDDDDPFSTLGRQLLAGQ